MLVLFLIFIYDLSKGLSCTTKLFGDDKLITAIVNEPNETARKLNNDFKFISSWVYQRKLHSNAGISKKAHEVNLYKKTTKMTCTPLLFNNISVSCSFHLKIQLKIKTGISTIKKVQQCLPRKTQYIFYKPFINN